MASELKPCGGCGATSDRERCIGCLHDFGTTESAWVRTDLSPGAVAIGKVLHGDEGELDDLTQSQIRTLNIAATLAAEAELATRPAPAATDTGLEPWGYGWYEQGGKKMASGYLPTINYPRSEDVTEGPSPLYTAPQQPAVSPDATGKCGELETVAQAHFDEFGEFDDIAWIKGFHPHPECIQLVTRSQAEELLAAERAEKDIAERNRDAARENFLTIQKSAAKLIQRAEKAEANIAAKDARIKELDRCHEGTIDLCNQKTAQIKALEAKLAAANDLVVRAQVIIPDHYANWHRAARAVLGGRPS